LHVILTAIGSAGDVHPLVALGVRLRERGHRVTVMAIATFEELITRCGLKMVPLLSAEAFERLKRRPELWHPLRGPRTVLQQTAGELLRPIYQAVVERYVPGETVVGAHALDFASRIAQEKLGVPVASIHLAPMSLRSVCDPPVLLPSMHGLMQRPTLARMGYWLADRMIIDRILAGPVGSLRRELGLPPVRRYMHRWMFSPERVLGLFPDWFAAPPPDWPPNTELTGFPLWDESDVREEVAGLEEFLSKCCGESVEAGDGPIVFTAGSANASANGFFATAVDACRRLGRPAVLLTAHPELLPRDLPESVRHFHYVPLSRVLPRAAAFVHHGGIGSSAQGLAAGTPQLVMPMAYDQPDNAARLERLGVAEWLVPRCFSVGNVTAALGRLIESRAVHARCREVAERCDGPAAIDRACDALEGLGQE